MDPSNYKDKNFDVKNYPDNIPKEIHKLLTLPPAIPSNFPTNYGLPSSFYNVHYPYHNNNLQYNLNNIHSNYSNYNSVWNNISPRFNYQFDSSMPISKMAEDKMKPAFKSIEMILKTFNSINMILDSTYSTLYGSFRTITGVADQLIFLRNHLVELALLPRLLYLLIDFLKWLLKLLGISNTKLAKLLEKQNENDAWNEALAHSSSDVFKNIEYKNEHSNSPLGPIIIFFSLVLGTPYIIWRLLGASGTIPKINQPDWTMKNGRHFIAIGLYNFKARNSNELSFQKGQMLYIKPESLQPDSKWLVACTIGENQLRIGFIPLNFVKLLMNK